MPVNPQQDTTVRILSVAPLGLPGWLKIIVDELFVVYVEVATGVYPRGWQMSGTPGRPALILPLFPLAWVGKTNMLRIEKSPETKEPIWVWRERSRFENDIDATHALSYDYASIKKVRHIISEPQLRLEDRMWMCRVPTASGSWINAFMKVVDFPSGLVDSEFNSARWAARMMQQEIIIHQKAIAGAPSVVPGFLGLVTEPDRGIIGYLSEFVNDACTLAEVPHIHPTLNSMLRRAVEMLHNDAMIAHNDLHAGNVLVKQDGSGVFIIDFESGVDLRRKGIDLEAAVYSDNLIWSRYTGLATPPTGNKT
ncbi:hypothetical protein PG995_009529 [Apiospora arundinis]